MMQLLDAPGSLMAFVGGQFSKPEILISGVRRASPWLGAWGAPSDAAAPAASWEASLGTTALGNHFWFVAWFLTREKWYV